MRKYTHIVIMKGVLTGDGRVDIVAGEHTSEALAKKRVGRLIAISGGKRKKDDFVIIEISPKKDKK
jgi:hypothetical protein